MWNELKKILGSALEEMLALVIKEDEVPIFFLRLALMIYIATTIIFYFLPESSHNRIANVIASACGIVLLFFTYRKKNFMIITHLTGILIIALTLYAATAAGGINSTTLIWLTVVPLMALILGGIKVGIYWLIFIQIILITIFISTRTGYISATVPINDNLIWGVLSNWVLCLFSPFLVVLLYHYLQEKRLILLENENNNLISSQEELIKVQSHKEEFIAAMGHELRTPMNIILGLNSIIIDKIKGHTDEFEAAINIKRSTEHLLNTINNVLDYAQLQSGKIRLNPDWFDPSELINESIESLSDQTKQKKIVIQYEKNYDKQLIVKIDPDRFTQVINHLMRNAIQHAEALIMVKLIVDQSLQKIKIEVFNDYDQNTCIDQDISFNKFLEQDLKDNQCSNGTGMGLSICQMLLKLQNGKIEVHNKSGEFICFWAEWPTTIDESYETQIKTNDSLFETKLELIIIDDYEMNLKISASIIKKILPNASITCFTNPNEAKQFLLSESCDVVITDFLMPICSGFELAEWIRCQSPPIRDVTIFGLTSSHSQQEFDRGINSGMNAVIEKPIQTKKLRHIIHDFINKSSRTS